MREETKTKNDGRRINRIWPITDRELVYISFTHTPRSDPALFTKPVGKLDGRRSSRAVDATAWSCSTRQQLGAVQCIQILGQSTWREYLFFLEKWLKQAQQLIEPVYRSTHSIGRVHFLSVTAGSMCSRSNNNRKLNAEWTLHSLVTDECNN